jgi:hypothetical protein
MSYDPSWTAPRDGQDWVDEDVLRATRWLRSFVPQREMERRLDAARETLLAARESIREGRAAPNHDPTDLAAWFILQAEAFAADRQYWVPEAAVRVNPTMTRLGKEFDRLTTIIGVEERAARLMTSERRQPDAGLFELLVALAYRRGGWEEVRFVPELPGISRTPDIHVARPRKRWAVECKRMMPSHYAAKEKLRGEALAAPVHALSLELGESIVVEVGYKIELTEVPEDYLPTRMRPLVSARCLDPWEDDIAFGQVRPVNWPLTRKVLAKDDVYFGSSRMIELLAGHYMHEADHSIAAKWRPSPARPAWAEAVFQASVVSWVSVSPTAVERKARHFKAILANAEGQLPNDRPGVIHVGMENMAGDHVDHMRHLSNWLEARFFEARNSRLRWVYGHYFVPELTTRKDESWAITETVAPFRIGYHRTEWPLPNQLLVTPADEMTDGVHWEDGASV